MTTPAPDSENPQRRVEQAVRGFLDRKRAQLANVGNDTRPLIDALDEFLGTGKRLRPAFCYWGWRGAGGGDSEQTVVAAAALEFLQASALVHDDVMDASDTRRGQPAVHHRFAALHRGHGWLGSPEVFGTGAAILAGDLCLSWADEMYRSCELPEEALRRGQEVFDTMRTELMCGQYLDLVEQARGGGSAEGALRVARYKSAKYTVQRPLHLGAALAGASSELTQAYSDYGLPLGEAFQLRDDVLGVFGDPERTGKPAGDDLREGKRTVLLATALSRASADQEQVLRAGVGDPELDSPGVARLRETIESTGALAECEVIISRRTEEALAALAVAPVTEESKRALTELAVTATARRS